MYSILLRKPSSIASRLVLLIIPLVTELLNAKGEPRAITNSPARILSGLSNSNGRKSFLRKKKHR